MSVVDWQEVAKDLGEVCPSSTYREEAARLLVKCAALGPLTGVDRTAANEFRRVYRFLHYNEAARLHSVVDELLASLQRKNAAPPSTRNAWNYVVGAYDRWIMRARVAYVVAGLLEGTLRSRLNARMTDEYGEKWFMIPECVPSSLRDMIQRDSAVQSLAAIQRVFEWQDGDSLAGSAQALLQAVRDVMTTTSSQEKQSAAEYVSHLSFGQLRTFFQAKRLWSKGPKLEQLFLAPGNASDPPLKSTVDEQLATIQKIRNEVAHYRPAPDTKFANSLYAAARVARWLDVDLQHFYGAVDTRMTTELSILVDDREQFPMAAEVARRCIEKDCAFSEPLVLMLDSAPRHRNDLDEPTGARLACPYHRIRLRQILHRPLGE